jgi:hypothetical protein
MTISFQPATAPEAIRSVPLRCRFAFPETRTAALIQHRFAILDLDRAALLGKRRGLPESEEARSTAMAGTTPFTIELMSADVQRRR